MFLGLSKNLLLECENLHFGYTLFLALKEANAKSLKDEYKCKCGETHTYLDGLITNYKTQNSISCYEFISNFQQRGEVEIKIGEALKVPIKSKLQKWHKVFLSSQGTESKGSHLLESIENPNWDYFYIITSSWNFRSEQQNTKHEAAVLGEKAKVGWLVYGCTDIKDLHVWQQLLLVSKEQLINEQYSLAYLTAAMTLESYLNLSIKNKLIEKGISENASEVILRETLIMDKLFAFSKDILAVDFSIGDYFKLSKNKLLTLFETRNKIAHGKRFEITKDEAYTAFEIVIRAILKVEETFNPQLFDFPQCFITEEVVEAIKKTSTE